MASIGLPYPAYFGRGDFFGSSSPTWSSFNGGQGPCCTRSSISSGWPERSGASVVVEFHEDQDSGETGMPLVERIVRPGLRHLIRSADHYVVHSEWDKDRLGAKFSLDPARVTVIPHGPYPIDEDELNRLETHEAPVTGTQPSLMGERRSPFSSSGRFVPTRGRKISSRLSTSCPAMGRYAGAFSPSGETWEGWELPAEKIRTSAFADDIEFVNRYVTDSELPALFDRADIVALPYHRASASGPLHMTMHRGLPVVVTNVGGLSEAAADYSGTVFVPPENPAALAEGIVSALELRAEHHADIHTWDVSRARYASLIEEIRFAHDDAAESNESQPSPRRPEHADTSTVTAGLVAARRTIATRPRFRWRSEPAVRGGSACIICVREIL